MTLTMIQTSTQFEADQLYNAIHYSDFAYDYTTAVSAYLKDFPALPSVPTTEYSYAPTSIPTWWSDFTHSTLLSDMTYLVSPRELKSLIEAELHQGLTQSAILQHWMKRSGSEIPLGSAAAAAALQDAIIVASDAEWYEHDDHFITELGISVLDPRSVPQPFSSSPWGILTSMENYHVRIKPHAHLTNKDLCEGHPDAFQFGSTTFVSVKEAKEMLRSIFTRRDIYGNLRPIIFVGHAVSNDYEVIKSRFGLDLEEIGTIVATIDTQVLAVEHGLVNPSRKIRLAHLLAEYDIKEPYLHNAGNDIVCTMIAAFLMLCPPTQTPLNKLHYVDLKAQLHNAGQTAIKEGRGYGVTHAKTLRVFGKRFFSTLKTTLMASDLAKLDGVSRSARLAKYVRTILIKDDQEKVMRSVLSSEAAIAKPIGADREEIESGVASLYIMDSQDHLIKRQCYQDPEELARLRATYRIWSRETVGILGVDKIAVAKLKAILQERLLSLDTLTIDYCDTGDGKKDTEATISLAQEIISGGKLAITSFQVYLHMRGLPWIGATLTLYLDRARQGEGLEFDLLRKVGLQLSSGGPSSDQLLSQIFHCAPMLEDLRLEHSGRTDAQLVDLLHRGKSVSPN
ncbi:uncharacterized protein J4E79_003704 [Alternaria viburni]|uniref:uncharacterized protein n=1 Tax=Alternaria viburni TaxID=566460 RepID=UPI0020C2D226|nr:uncharacterized protein J4E79_003704 [Alternaria viburni]KAI4664202.1 hypothetical protein J4E79_003704 [Alternaria viburni]